MEVSKNLKSLIINSLRSKLSKVEVIPVEEVSIDMRTMKSSDSNNIYIFFY